MNASTQAHSTDCDFTEPLLGMDERSLTLTSFVLSISSLVACAPKHSVQNLSNLQPVLSSGLLLDLSHSFAEGSADWRCA